MIFRVHVGVALHRPPEIHEYRLYLVDAGNEIEALGVALQMAACSSVMPVWGDVITEAPDAITR